MSKSIKIFLIFILTLVTLVISLTAAVNQKIDTEEISKFVKNDLEYAFPNTKIAVGKVDYSMGTMVRVYINNVTVKSKQKSLLNVQKVVLKVPLLSTIFGKGTIKIKVEKPFLNNDIYNFLKFKDKKQISLEIPNFIYKNKIDLNITNFLVEKHSKKINLKKILIKNLSLTKSMAYEVASDVNFTFGDISMSANSQLIGELNLNKLQDNKEIKSSALLDIKNVKDTEGVSYPRSRAKLELTWNQNKKVLTGKGQLSLNTVLESDLNFETDLKKIKLNLTQGAIVNENLPKVFNNQFFKNLDYQNSMTILNGSIVYDLATKELLPEIKLDIKKPIRHNFKNIPVDITLNAFISKKNIQTKITQNLTEGTITSNLRIDMKKSPLDFDLKNIDRIEGEVSVVGLKIKRSHLRFPKKDNKDSIKVVDFQSSKSNISPTVKLKVLGTNNYIGDVKFDSAFNFEVLKDDIFIKALKATTINGSLKADITYDKNNRKLTYATQFQNIELKGFGPVLPILMPNLTGKLSGKVKGFSHNKTFSHDVSLNLDSFIIDLVDLSSPVNKFLTDIGTSPLYQSDERLNSFKKIKANFRLHDQGLNIKTAILKSKKAEINITKALLRKKNKSYVLGKLVVSKKAIPFRFTGFDHTLNPDIEYSKKNK